MKLLTKELEKKFEEYPLRSQDGLGGEAKVIAKFFNPMGAGTWLITEGSKEGNDYIMFGFCNLVGMENAELGYVSLNELQSIKLPFGMTIERDLYFQNDITLREACKQEFGIVPDYLKPKSKVQVLQLKSDYNDNNSNEDTRSKRYAPLSILKNGVNSVYAQDYDSVYECTKQYVNLDDKSDYGDVLESLFMEFNADYKPSEYKGHSLSVSDVIILSCDGKEQAFYCDRFGFKKLPDLFLIDWNQIQKYTDYANENDKDITDED